MTQKPLLIFTSILLISLHANLPAQQPGDQMWFFPTGSAVVASPSIDAGGNIIVGSEDFFSYSLTPDQQLNWVQETTDLVTGNSAASPLGYTVFGSWDGQIYAVNSDGSLRWSYDADAFISASPAISAGGKIYIGSRDGLFYALNPDGSLHWAYVANDSIRSGAAIGPDGAIYFGDESGTFYALNKDGTLKWEFQADIIDGRDSRIRTIPAIDKDHTIYFGSGNHYFYALYSNGDVKWKFETDDKNDSSPVIDTEGNIIFASRDGYLYKLKPGLGVPAWSKVVGDVFYSSPVIDAQNNIYIVAFVGSGLSRLYSVDSESTTLWTLNYGGLNDSSPVLSQDGFLYVGFHDGNVYKIYAGNGPANSEWPMEGRSAARTANLDEAFATAERKENWLLSNWFGWVSDTGGGWHYHLEHHWYYTTNKNPDNYWYFDKSMGTYVWTSQSFYPFIFLRDHGWVFFLPETIAPDRWFYSYTNNEWIVEGNLTP